ncbi:MULTISPECIES: fimbrial assembly family protein [unclassified Caballeronia]|uniref:fimbrial assembly family protein n=1 Tax=unclassified Caballeronia TaxID=2646786 RepID=UPI002027A8DC|nr:MULTISPECIES: fimbrial assembly family protein [unclassified Caballeronia]MDR5766345.1 fimbrial assembly family protein [Caballeronia sp. LZ028]
MNAAMLDGFNLLPYRARKRRELRRQRLALIGAVTLAGCAAVGAVAGHDLFERARLDERRVALETSLRASSAQIDEHARLVRAESERRRAREAAQPLALPRERFLALLEALADSPLQRGVALQRVSQRTNEVELAALAPDSQAASQWLKRLERLRGVQAVDVIEMKRRANGIPSTQPARRAASTASDEHAARFEFVALVRYAPDHSRDETASRQARPVLAATQGERP